MDKKEVLIEVKDLKKYFQVGKNQTHLPKDGKMNISPKELFSAQLIAIAVFAVSNLSFQCRLITYG